MTQLDNVDEPDGLVGSGSTPGGSDPGSVVSTPPPTQRSSAVVPWDVSTRPAGPKPEVGRTYTDEELASGRRLMEIHGYLRAELGEVRDLVAQVAAGSIGIGEARSHLNIMTLRQDRSTVGEFCQAYCQMVAGHHSIEDAHLFPRLLSGDASLAPVVDRLKEEHLIIHDIVDGTDRALVALADGSGTIDAVHAAVDLLTDSLQSHLSYEEGVLIEPFARLRIL